MPANKKTAIVLLNLGGPEKPDQVRSFLYNLFSDPLIIRLPTILRKPIAFLISYSRAPKAQERYNLIGGGSPLLENTKMQAEKLNQILNKKNSGIKIFIAMRYGHPFAKEAVQQIKNFAPDEIILLPLYPQYSTTTTESSFRDWRQASNKMNLTAKTKAICCWADHKDFIAAHADLLQAEMNKTQAREFHILFSAHSLPERVIHSGDPYQKQTEITARAISDKIGLKPDQWSLAYQSRVGPLPWIGPDTKDEICRLAQKTKAIFLVPISFVSEHIETLVELDIEFGDIAKQAGCENYIRVPALGTHQRFIACLADLAQSGMDADMPAENFPENLLCPKHLPGAPCTDVFRHD